MSNVEAIKKALEGVTTYHGPWEVGELISGKRGRSDAFELQNATDIFGYIYCGHATPGEVKPVADFIAAANPIAISELLTTLEALQRENEALREALKPFAKFATKAERFVEGRALCGGSPILPVKDFRLADFERARQALASAEARLRGSSDD